MTALFHTFVSKPLYSGLVYLIGALPFFDVGIVIIIFTIIVKFILLPLSIKATKSQLQMKSAEKDLKDIKEKYTDKNEQGLKIMEYYKEKGMNPFTSILVIFIQLPILFALYRVFVGLPQINPELLYSFIKIPENINMHFLGLVDISQKSLLIAVLVAITTYFQTSLASGSNQTTTDQNDFTKAMHFQMKYFLPPFIAFIVYNISSAVALYFCVSNVFSIIQEYYIRKKYHKSVTVV